MKLIWAFGLSFRFEGGGHFSLELEKRNNMKCWWPVTEGSAMKHQSNSYRTSCVFMCLPVLGPYGFGF